MEQNHDHVHVGQPEEELNQTKEIFYEVEEEEERDRGSDEHEDMKKKPNEEEVDTREEDTESWEVHENLNDEELVGQKKNNASLKMEVVDHQKLSDQAQEITGSLSDYKRRVKELEAELDKRKESEANLFDSLVMQTRLLEQNKVSLEESKLEIASLRRKSEDHNTTKKKIPDDESQDDGQEIRVQEEKKLSGAESEDEKVASMKAESGMLEKISSLKYELKLATEAEENSKKAMDDLALALKEVATESNEVKEKLTLNQVELEHSKEEAERLRVMLKTTEDNYEELLEELRKDADRYKNTAERLRLEAEESLLAWNEKEIEFVNCIRRAEEERSAAQTETNRLLELLAVAENKTEESKEENQKLRDILKQALNEANVAKEAAAIARDENSQLQDSLAGKEEAMRLLVQENEMLKTHEAAALENIRELKRLLSAESSSSSPSVKELKIEDHNHKEKLSTKEGNNNKEDKEVGRKGNVQNNATDKEQQKESKSIISKTFSFNLKDIKLSPRPHSKEAGNEEGNKETFSEDDTLKGSIFDESANTPDATASHHHVRGVTHSYDFDHLDESHLDDLENDRNSRKRRALLQRFGDLIRRRGYHRREPSNEECLPT